MSATSSAYESVAVVEIQSIARGYATLDAIAKRARVHVRLARACSPGKFIILFGGDVASVGESLEAAREVARSELIDELFLALAHPELLRAMEGHAAVEPGDAVVVLEFATVASTLRAADIALKACQVAVVRMRLALGLGGKGYFVLMGTLADVEAAADAARQGTPEDKLVAIELIAQPHPEVRGFFS